MDTPGSGVSRQFFAFDILAISSLVATVLLLYRRITLLWWTMDDAFHLHVLTEHPHSTYLGPAVWRTFGNKVYTPLLLISLEADRHLVGYAPAFFYRHQEISLALVAIAFYVLLRLWCPPLIASGGTLLLLAGTPFCTIAQQLMDRHYIEGLVCVAISATLYVLAVRRRSLSCEALSAAACLLAMLAKEIYVPLPAILLLLPEGPISIRLRRLRLHGAVLIAYLALRWWSLGTLGGGYGWAIVVSEWPRVAAAFSVALVRQLLGGAPTASIIAAVIVASLIVIAPRRRRALLALPAAFVLAFAPLLPVAKAHEPRYGLGVWILLVSVVTIAATLLDREHRPRMAMALLGPAVVATLIANRVAWRPALEQALEMSAEARWFFDAGPHQLLRDPAVPPAAMGELSWLKTVQQKPAGTSWFYDDLYLCSRPGPQRIFEYRPAISQVGDVTDVVMAAEPSVCRAAAGRSPLSATFRYAGGVLHWTLGPYRSGQYRFLIGDGIQAFDVPADDGFQLSGESITLRIVHVDPGGTRVYSPPIALDYVRHPVTTWRR